MIVVLHAALRDRLLAVWGEVPFEAVQAPGPRRRGRLRKDFDVPPPARCGASLDRLRDALRRAGIDLRGEERTLVGWLPTAAGRPVPSSPLIGEAPESERVTIAPWSIDAIELAADDAISLLASAVGKRLLAAGVLVGADLAFFAT